PNEVDITDFIQPAGSMLTIEVLGHRRNSHGPAHLAEQPRGIWPGSWRAKDDLWFDGYKLVPCGLTSKPALVTRK
ncbi:MAG: hypothetical protein MUO30_00095, partial [Anaerolineales bacterium]|nr:hypothetical protein [Anaerolineales bacterium]